jgi:hypothetical protein
MKIRVCDYCHKVEGKLVETVKYFRWKNSRTGFALNVDLCEPHTKLPKTLGLRTVDQAIGWVESDFKTVPPATTVPAVTPAKLAALEALGKKEVTRG